MPSSNRETKFVNTYEPPNASEPIEVVNDYHRVREYVSVHPDHGRRRASTNLGLNEHRIRGWMNETSKPDVVRGLEVAQEHGWLTIDGDDARQPALAILVSGIFACGGISTSWVPSWAPSTDEGRDHIRDALNELTDGYTVRHKDDEGKPTEWLPNENPSVLGRVLVAYGAPQGDKNEESVAGLPKWLLTAPMDTRRAAVDLFVLERGTFFESKDTVQIRSRNRQQSYRDDVAKLIGSVVNAPVRSKVNVVLSAEAVRELRFGRDDFPTRTRH